MKLLSISQSEKPDKKLKAVFELDDKSTKTTHFGSKQHNDFIIYSKQDKKNAEKRKELYINRHKVNENWDIPTSPGALSRFILWNKVSLNASIADFKRRFNL